MKRNLFGSLLALALLLFPALAQGEDCVFVRLNDGAPIPYLDGQADGFFGDWIYGITGAVDAPSQTCDGSLYDTEGNVVGVSGFAGYTLTLQNIAMTDDSFVVFYEMRAGEPFAFPYGASQYFVDKIGSVALVGAGEDGAVRYGLTSDCLRMARLVDERTALCAAIVPLLCPLPDGEIVCLQMGGFSEVTRLRIDKSAAVTPDQRFEIGRELTFTGLEQAEGPAFDCTFVLESITFSPFGNRIVVDQWDRGEGAPMLSSLLLRDAEGTMITCWADSLVRSSLASEEHPIWTRTLLNFAGGRAGDAVTLMPAASGSGESKSWSVCVDLSDLPAHLEVEGHTLDVERFELSETGFEVFCRTELEDVRCAAADAAHEELAFYPVSYGYTDRETGCRVVGAYWADEYKGRSVRRVQKEELERIRSLLLSGFLYTDPTPVVEQAVTIPLR